MGNNNAWFQQNCDPGQSAEDQQEIQSGGGAVNTTADGSGIAQRTQELPDAEETIQQSSASDLQSGGGAVDDVPKIQLTSPLDGNCYGQETEEQEEVQSGGGPIGAPSGGAAPNTIDAVVEQLIGQCYGDPLQRGDNFPTPDQDDFNNRWGFDWDFLIPILEGEGLAVPDMGRLELYVPSVEDDRDDHICIGLHNEPIVCPPRKNPDLEKCLKEHLKCLFKPYVGGAWKPPKADCDSFTPQSMFGVSRKICIRNCVTERIPVYEHILGTSPTATATFSDKDTLTVSGTGTCIVTLEHRWKDQQYSAGTAVDTINVGGATFTRSGTRGVTTQTLSLTAGTYSITYTGLHPTGGYNIEVNQEYGTNKTIVFRDGHGSDVNGRFSILSNSISSDHMYSISNSQPGGYVSKSEPHFYGHASQSARGSVPVYISYSSTTVDHMLTTDPAGEVSTMNAAGMGSRDTVLFYGFSDKQDMISELMDGEIAAPLYRYYSPQSNDHRYTLTPIGGPPIESNLREGFYKLNDKAETYLNFTFNCEKGSAAYDNTMGWYVTNANDEPIHGRVLLENATDASGRFDFKVTAEELNQYIPCKLGFFMIPDGDNRGTSRGDAVTFTNTGNGWRIDQSTSAQSANLVAFSQPHLNKNGKDMTRWPDRTWQYWEDLIDNPDNDYNDMKLSYHLRYGGSEYLYEGIQCYVFTNPAVPEYADIVTQDNQCDKAIFKKEFRNIAMTRNECGKMNETKENFGCSSCTGGVSYKLNTTQSLRVKRDANLSIRSNGGMTGGYGDCTEFTWALRRNGTEFYEKRSKVRDWEKIGKTLVTFMVAKGDKITFQLKSIDAGHYNGRVTPSMSIRDEDTGEFLFHWDLLLTTVSQSYRTTNPAQNNGNLASHEPTEPCGLPISMQMFNYEEDDDDNTKENYTTVLSNRVVSGSQGVSGNGLEVRGYDETINLKYADQYRVFDLNDNDTGFVEAEGANGVVLKLKYTVHDAEESETNWELVEVLDYGSGGFQVNDEFNIVVGEADDDDDDFLYGRNEYYLGIKVTGINDVECPQSSNTDGEINDISIGAQTAFLSEPRQINQVVVDNKVMQANTYVVNMDEIFGSMFRIDESNQAQSFHEYFLKQTSLGNEVIFMTDYLDTESKGKPLKIRLKIKVTYQFAYQNGDTYRFKRYGFFGNVNIHQVMSYGKAYSEGFVMRVDWPPTQLQYTQGREPESPFFPKQTELPRNVRVRDATNGRYKRNARFAIYQQMHDKTSQVWYSNQNSYLPNQQRWFDIIATEVN